MWITTVLSLPKDFSRGSAGIFTPVHLLPRAGGFQPRAREGRVYGASTLFAHGIDLSAGSRIRNYSPPSVDSKRILMKKIRTC